MPKTLTAPTSTPAPSDGAKRSRESKIATSVGMGVVDRVGVGAGEGSGVAEDKVRLTVGMDVGEESGVGEEKVRLTVGMGVGVIADSSSLVTV